MHIQIKVFSQSSPFRPAGQRVRAHVPVCDTRRAAGRPPFRPQAGVTTEDPFFLFSLSQPTHFRRNPMPTTIINNTQINIQTLGEIFKIQFNQQSSINFGINQRLCG